METVLVTSPLVIVAVILVNRSLFIYSFSILKDVSVIC